MAALLVEEFLMRIDKEAKQDRCILINEEIGTGVVNAGGLGSKAGQKDH